MSPWALAHPAGPTSQPAHLPHRSPSPTVLLARPLQGHVPVGPARRRRPEGIRATPRVLPLTYRHSRLSIPFPLPLGLPSSDPPPHRTPPVVTCRRPSRSGTTPGCARAFSSCSGLGLVLSPNSRSRRGPASSASRSPPRRPPTRPRLRRALLLLN